MNRVKILLTLLAVVVSVASVVAAFRLLNPTPPRVVTISSGPVGSAYERVAEQYRDILAESRVELVLQPSAGSRENLVRLSQSESDVGFLTMGTPDTREAQNLSSLGAMFFEPLWIFAREPEIFAGAMTQLDGSRIAIGPAGSRTNAATRYLLELNGIDAASLTLLELEPVKAEQRLRDGEVEAVAIVSNAASPVLKRLLSMEGVALVDFVRADAYTALFPELRKLVVPAGIGSLVHNLPAQDTRILAFTTILAVRNGLHPITRSLLLDAASRVHSAPDMFHQAGDFPLAIDQVIPLSDSALAYYSDGQPLLLRLLPYWLAVLVMQALVAAIPLLTIVYPLLKLMPSLFDWAMRRQFYKVYVELRQMDRGLSTAQAGQIEQYKTRLQELEQRATTLRVPVTYASMLYALKAHIGAVRQKVHAASEGGRQGA